MLKSEEHNDKADIEFLPIYSFKPPLYPIQSKNFENDDKIPRLHSMLTSEKIYHSDHPSLASMGYCHKALDSKEAKKI